MSVFSGKHIILGVTGSIAIYRALDIARRLTQAGALVDVIMTAGARAFIAPLTFASLTAREVVTDQFDPHSELSIRHVRMAERAALMVVAPATAHEIAKLALGLADDALGSTALALRAPLVVAPAMETAMLMHAATQAHLATLRERGVTIVEPETGPLASGQVGAGRLAAVETILGWCAAVLGRSGDLAGHSIIVTAGGTQEPIDPVRRITNRSSGKMGFALAEAARDRGARVVLVAAPTSLTPPVAVDVVPVVTAAEMAAAVLERADQADVVIKAAAVADFRPAHSAEHKIKRGDLIQITLTLVQNDDIAATIGERRKATGRPRVLVVFAAEGEDPLVNARRKLEAKNADLLVLNDITSPQAGFEADTNQVSILDRGGGVESLPLLPKADVAHRILDRVAALLG